MRLQLGTKQIMRTQFQVATRQRHEGNEYTIKNLLPSTNYRVKIVPVISGVSHDDFAATEYFRTSDGQTGEEILSV